MSAAFSAVILIMNPELTSLVLDNFETYDPFIIREALNNAIAHQEYLRVFGWS